MSRPASTASTTCRPPKTETSICATRFKRSLWSSPISMLGRKDATALTLPVLRLLEEADRSTARRVRQPALRIHPGPPGYCEDDLVSSCRHRAGIHGFHRLVRPRPNVEHDLGAVYLSAYHFGVEQRARTGIDAHSDSPGHISARLIQHQNRRSLVLRRAPPSAGSPTCRKSWRAAWPPIGRQTNTLSSRSS